MNTRTLTHQLGEREARPRTSSGRKVQLALDLPTIPGALEALRTTAEFVDVIEVGTLLCLSEGMHAVRAIRAAYPEHVVLADIRLAEAGGVLAPMAYEAGADWVTVVSGAAPSTFAVVRDIAAEAGGDVQVELSDGWSWDLVDRCRALGIRHFILHRSRDAEAQGDLTWPSSDLDAISRIYGSGGRITVTGGLNATQVHDFAPLPVELFIAGRALYAAADPAAAAREFRSAVRSLPEIHPDTAWGRTLEQGESQ